MYRRFLRFLLTVPALLMIHGAALADATSDFLVARPVRNFVRIGFVNEKSPQLVYALDSFDVNDQKTLVKDLTFSSARTVDRS